MFPKRSGFGILIEYSGLNGSRFIFVLLLIYLNLLIIPMAGCAAERERSDATPKEQNSKKIVNSIKTQVGDLTLTLSGCVLKMDSGDDHDTYDIPLPGNCRFIVERDGTPQIVETLLGPVLLVASSFPLTDSRLCDTRIRAIVVQKGRVLISQGEQRIRSCATGPFDTKMFHVLAGSAVTP
jgi:hypothetical protein